MYEQYWQLTQQPFGDICPAGAYFPAEPHQGALLKLRYAIEQGCGAATLTGPAGVGKSLLVDMLRQQLDERFQPFAQLAFPLLTRAEFLAYLAEELSGTRFIGTPDARTSLRRFEDALAAKVADGRRPVLVIEEAQLLQDAQLLEMLPLLLIPPAGGHNPLTLSFVGQGQLLKILHRSTALNSRVAVRCQLRSLNAQETEQYVRQRLHAVGCTRELFDRSACRTLFELSGGNPRRINRLCDLALLVGFAESCQQITSAVLDAVEGEMLPLAA